jgi:hypothetical protein
MGFNTDLALGNKGEVLVQKLFKKCEIILSLNTENNIEYDLYGLFKKKKISIEVKYDWLSQKTNNIAIEYFNCLQNKDSGINKTKALFWIHIIEDLKFPTIWITSVIRLKNYIKSHPPFKTMSKIGDGNSNIYLYNVDKILPDIFYRIDNITTDEVIKVLKELIKDK